MPKRVSIPMPLILTTTFGHDATWRIPVCHHRADFVPVGVRDGFGGRLDGSAQKWCAERRAPVSASSGNWGWKTMASKEYPRSPRKGEGPAETGLRQHSEAR